ncbi:hypothetical protein FGB62_5g123 [Gracilaria domingensis]|nr:hypothetical protein FGB62_5g123 [Gracilaria domingensis]
MIVLRIDSRFVNAAIYVVIDVICFSIISLQLRKLQTSVTKYRLRRGQHVELQESHFSFLAGGALADGSLLFPFLAILHFLLMALLFFFTLGVSGTSTIALVPASRTYITRLATNRTEDIVRSRLNPKFFAGCVRSAESSLKYYPTAFNVNGNLTITDLYTFTDNNSNVASVDIRDMLCQKFENLPPLMNVVQCGETNVQCSNLNVSNFITVHVRKEHDFKFETVGGGYSLLGAYMNVKSEAKHIWETEYDRFICFEQPRRGSAETPLGAFFNCVLGRWDEEETIFKFRIGKGLLPYSPTVLEDLQNTTVNSTFAFRGTSAEVVLSWDRSKNGEWIFIQASTHIGKDMIDARTFLNNMVSRTIVAEKADGSSLLREESVPATEIEIFSFVGYIVVLAVSTTILIVRIAHVSPINRLLGVANIWVDVTSYNGLLAIFQHEGYGTSVPQRNVKFGIVKDEISEILSIRPVQDGDQSVPVNRETYVAPETKMIRRKNVRSSAET